MQARRVVFRARARQDVDSAADWYLENGGLAAAESFIRAIERTLRLISAAPAAGSPRYASELRLEGLRHFPVPGFPWLVFYVDRESRVDIWRVLAAQRDIPVSLQEPDPLP